MASIAELPLLMIVTDRAIVPEEEVFARLERAPAPVLVQLRDKRDSWIERFAFGRRLLAARGRHILVVNGDLNLALELGTHALHLPARRWLEVTDARTALGPSSCITVACHEPSEVMRAAQLGADAALLSPIFPSPGKGPPLGLAALELARKEIDQHGLSCRLIALGGVDGSNASDCLRAGAHGVAALRADLGPWLAAQAPDAHARR